MNVSIKLKGISKLATGRRDWSVCFEMLANSTSSDIAVLVPAETSDDEIIRLARAKLRETLLAAAEQMGGDQPVT